MKHEQKLLTPRDVGKMLGFKPRTITRWCREGTFPSARKVGRVWRIYLYDDKLELMLKVKKASDASS